MEKETNGIPLDVKIEKDTNKFLISITGNHFYWAIHTLGFVGPSKRKTNLIGTLVHRALKICSKHKLQQELVGGEN